MRTQVLIFSLLGILLLPLAGYSSENAKNLFVIVTADDEITQLMSMVLATQAMKQGAGVDVLVCGAAGELAVVGAPEKVLKPLNKSPQMLMKGLMQQGVNVQICPIYLPNVGKTEADLLQGISVARPPEIAAKLLREDTKILSY